MIFFFFYYKIVICPIKHLTFDTMIKITLMAFENVFNQ